MKFMFCVQGEGRGHMTQAIALQNLILKHGHELVAVVVGKSERREIPTFFHQQIKTEVVALESPNFVTHKDNKSINITATIVQNLKKFSHYWKNVRKLHFIVAKQKPDVIINFYEFLCGVYISTHRPQVRHICIGHQFLLEHPEFVFPENLGKRDRFWYFVNTAISAPKFEKKLALSFRKIEDNQLKKICVVPPLLRTEVLELKPLQGDYVLMYVVNAGFSDDIIEWHKNNTHVKIHLFTDRKDIVDETVFHQTLTVHKLNDKKFLTLMKDCKAYASTAGFESICEAMYLGKPVLLVPPRGHFEQQCNALDAVLSGAGITSNFFDLDTFLKYIDTHSNDKKETFKTWVDGAEAYFSRHLFQ